MNRQWFIFFLIFIGACSTKKYFPEKFHIVERKLVLSSRSIDSYDLENYLRVQPDKKVLGIRLYTGFYLWGYSMKDKTSQKKAKWEKRHQRLKARNAHKYNVKLEKHLRSSFKNWLMNDVGEQPSFYDTMLVKQDKENILLYCKQKGYFDAYVKDSIVHLKKNRIKLFYIVQLEDPYLINSIRRLSGDPYIKNYLQATTHLSLIQPGMRYDEDKLEQERTRITKDLRNSGFYFFTKDFIRFYADSSKKNKSIQLDLVVSNPGSSSSHPRFKMDKIYVFPNFSFTNENISSYDTVPYVTSKKNLHDTLYFVYSGKASVKPKIIARKLYFTRGQWFNEQDAEKTLSALSALEVFKYTNLRYQVKLDSQSNIGRLTTFVELSPITAKSIQFEIDATNNGGNLGMAANFVYRNKNFLHNAQKLSLSTHGGLELQKAFFETNAYSQIIKALPFNSAEYSFQISLLSPISSSIFARSARPVSRFYANYNYQLRPNYVRYISTLSASVEFQESKNRFIQIYAPLNLVKIFPDSVFNARLLTYPKPLRYSYTDHLLPVLGVTINYSNADAKTRKLTSSRRTNIEMAGLSYWVANGFNNALQNEVYKVLNIVYSQYIKTDVDQRYYFRLAESHTLAIRLFTGVGFPFGNSVVLPFEKSYTASGANDIRAWRYRSLGPGAYTDTTAIDRTGDLALVSSVEYRFPIKSWFKGALFCDVGNIWLWHKNKEFPHGEFSFHFYQQLAVGSGLGLRLDFDFLIIRLDAAVPLRDPAKMEHPALTLKESLKRLNLNFGIGYPF